MTTKILYIIQSRHIKGFEAGAWEDVPESCGQHADLYAAMQVRDGVKGMMDKTYSPPSIPKPLIEIHAMRDIVKDAGYRIELRIIKRTLSYTDEIVDEAERVL